MAIHKVWLKGGVALVATWAIVGVGVWSLQREKPTAAKTVSFLAAHPLPPPTQTSQREQWIDQFAAQVNHLDFDERHKLLLTVGLGPVFGRMTAAEQSRYLDLTLARGLQQMLEGFSRLSPERRQRLLDQALNELDKIQLGQREQLRQQIGDAALQRIVKEGLTSFFSDASAATKLELQPVLEQMQNIVQMAR